MSSKVSWKIRRMSLSQLRVLLVLVKNSSGVVAVDKVGKVLALDGKAMGGVFSSLSRQRVGDQALVLPCGRSKNGRGLRWKLNTNLVKKAELKSLLLELLEGWK